MKLDNICNKLKVKVIKSYMVIITIELALLLSCRLIIQFGLNATHAVHRTSNFLLVTSHFVVSRTLWEQNVKFRIVFLTNEAIAGVPRSNQHPFNERDSSRAVQCEPMKYDIQVPISIHKALWRFENLFWNWNKKKGYYIIFLNFS